MLALLLLPLSASAFSLLGYYTGDSDSFASLESSGVDAVAFDAYDINAKGAIQGSDFPQGLAFADAHNLTTYVTVSNYARNDFRGFITHSIFKNPTYRAKALKNLVALTAKSYKGLNCDFESVYASDRAGYTSFMTELSAMLHAKGLRLMLSVPGMEHDSPKDSWNGAYNFTALGQVVDVLQVMTYDENGPWGPPGPVAGLDWLSKCINYATSVVSKSKVSQGTNAYGYNWFGSSGTSVSYKDFPALIAKTGATVIFDAPTSSVHFNYTASGVFHQAWFDNNVTIGLKAKFAKSAGVQGMSMWSMGQEDATFWAAIRAA